MESFKTQFMMSGVRTYVTVEPLNAGRFGCTLNLVEFFDADEVPVDSHDFDFVLSKNGKLHWQTEGATKVTMTQEDLDLLGAAISQNEG
jgi:hypothetical protein